MKKNIKFNQNQIVKFKKSAPVFDLDNKTELIIPVGTTAKVVLDEDRGDIGSCKIKLAKADGSVVLAETNDQNLEADK